MNLIKVRKIIYKSLSKLDGILGVQSKVIVLCYHSFRPESAWRFSVTISELEKQLKYLSEHYEFISMEDLQGYLEEDKPLPVHSVLISLDDGYKDNLDVVELFDKYKLKPLMFVLSDPLRVNRKEMENDLELLSEDDIKLLGTKDWDIGSHGHTHSNLLAIDLNMAKDEISNPLALKAFSYPKGRYNKQIIELVKAAGYKLAFSMDDGYINNSTNRYAIPRIGVDSSHTLDEFIASISPSVIFFRSLIKFLFPVTLIERIIK